MSEMLLSKRIMDGEHVMRHVAEDVIVMRFMHRGKSGARVQTV
jgi:hypothetical protein